MSNEENRTNNAEETFEDVNSFLDGLSSTESADEFLNKLYDESFDSITSDFDALLQEFRDIDPDDPVAGEAKSEEAPAPAQPIREVYSYSDPTAEEAQTHRRFFETVQEAMDAEVGETPKAEQTDAFHLSLDKIEGEDHGFGEALTEAAAPARTPAVSQQTRVYSADAVRNGANEPARRPAPQRAPGNGAPAKGAPAKGAPAKGAPKNGKNTKDTKKKKKSALLPNRDDSTLEIFRKVLFMVSMVVVVICLGIIGNTYLVQPYMQKNRESEMQKLLDSGVTDEKSFHAAYGDTELPAGANYNLAQFYAANSDFYGYLEIPGTSISTPVVQGKDNSKYLKQNFFGDATKYGCPFVNYQNTYHALDYNTSIFGHNMEYDDLVFGELEKYRTIDGFKKAPLIHLETMYNDYYFKVYAVFLTDSKADSSGWYFDYIFTQLKDEAECQEYIDQLNERRLYSTGVDIQPSDKLITLSTCAYDFGDERLVVVGRLVREGESKDVDVSKAVVSSNPRYPARYYSKKGIANPYASASKWIPNA